MDHLLKDGDTFGPFTIDRFLGEGAFAEVYRVSHPFLGRQAMKVFKAVGITFDETRKMLEEAVILSLINHPNIIRVFDANVIETALGQRGYFTMEYVAMGNLEQYRQNYIDSHKRLMPVEEVVNITRQICRGLAAAHGRNPPIIHRDIKPQNILVGIDYDGLRVRISDFGLAKNLNPLALKATSRGTIMFKPPEVFAGTYNDSLAGDVWALGTTLYLLLTDELPFDLNLLMEMRFGEELHALAPPRQINPFVDRALERIVLKALAIDQRKRYPTAKEMLADLEKWSPKPKTADTPAAPHKDSTSTTIIHNITGINPKEAQDLAKQALKLSKQPYRLSEAADLMEQAFRKDPTLKDEYEYQVTLWRRGIMN